MSLNNRHWMWDIKYLNIVISVGRFYNFKNQNRPTNFGSIDFSRLVRFLVKPCSPRVEIVTIIGDWSNQKSNNIIITKPIVQEGDWSNYKFINVTVTNLVGQGLFVIFFSLDKYTIKIVHSMTIWYLMKYYNLPNFEGTQKKKEKRNAKKKSQAVKP